MNNIPKAYNQINLRNYVGECKAYKWKIKPIDATNLPLTQHEITHITIEDIKSQKIVAIFTSSQGNKKISNVTFEKVSPIKHDGSYTPILNKLTKEPLMDDYGYTIPNEKKGGQFIVTLANP